MVLPIYLNNTVNSEIASINLTTAGSEAISKYFILGKT